MDERFRKTGMQKQLNCSDQVDPTLGLFALNRIYADSLTVETSTPVTFILPNYRKQVIKKEEEGQETLLFLL